MKALRLPRLPRPVAFYLLASVIVSFLAGSSAPTQLYAVYASRWGFSPITTTVIFGVYALFVEKLVRGGEQPVPGRPPSRPLRRRPGLNWPGGWCGSHDLTVSDRSV